MMNRLGFVVVSTCISLFAITPIAQSGPVDDLQAGHWYEVPNSSLNSVTPNPLPPGFRGAIMDAWSGGAYDTVRDRLIVWGGGHGDYAGNEVYVFDINTMSWSRLTDPSADTGGSEVGGLYPDGLPRSRHTYNYLEYAPNADRFYSIGGGVMYPVGQTNDTKVHAFNFNTLTWDSTLSRIPEQNPNTIAAISAYDPVTGKIWYRSTYSGNLAAYDPVADQWSPNYGGNYYLSYGTTAAVDSKRHKMVAAGRGIVLLFDLDNPGDPVEIPTSGNLSIQNSFYPGFVYDPVSDQYVGWHGGGDVYTLNPDTWAWSKLSLAGSNTVVPDAPNSNGTYGRFRYIPSKNAFIGVNRTNGSVYFYKLSNVAGDNLAPNQPVQVSVQ